jgi:exonuclease III
MTYWQWNANGLKNKKEWLMDTIYSANDLPDVIMVSETHCHLRQVAPYIEGYSHWCSNHETGSKGTAIYYRTILPAARIDDGTNARVTAGIIRGTVCIAVYAPVN